MNLPNQFHHIRKHGEKWFLYYGPNDENFFLSPSNPMFDSIWEGVSKLLDVYIDDCGANLRRCVDFCKQASNLFAGVSKLAQDLANDYQDTINNL